VSAHRAGVVAVALVVALGCTPEHLQRDVHGRTALHNAAEAGDVDRVTALLEKRAPPNLQDIDGVAPLHRAARDGDLAVAKTLLEYGADPNLKTKDGWDALHLAARKGRSAMVELLLRFNAQANARTADGWTVLHLAALSGDHDSAAHVLKDWPQYERHGKPNIDARDEMNKTPLQRAIERAHPQLASLFIREGADLSVTDEQGYTPLHHVAGTGSTFLVDQLLIYGADPDAKAADGKTPYDIAIEAGDEAIAKILRGA